MANTAVTTLLRPFLARPEASETRDKKWFAGVYEQNFDSVYRYALTLVRDESQAEDIAADVFLKAWRSRQSFRGQGSVTSWLLSITHNEALSALRAASRQPTADAGVLDLRHDTDPTPEAAVELAADSDELQSAMVHLTPEQQQVLFLRFFEGLPHEAVAERLGRNANAVRALQFRALNRLRGLMEASHAG